MNLLIYAVLGLAATWVLYVGYLYIATRAAEGRSADSLAQLFPRIQTHPGRALVYCFSPSCRPCRPMSREVDALIEQGEPLFKLDISAHPEVGREFGIRATPTLIVIDDEVVTKMVLGAKTGRFMHELLSKSG